MSTVDPASELINLRYRISVVVGDNEVLETVAKGTWTIGTAFELPPLPTLSTPYILHFYGPCSGAFFTLKIDDWPCPYDECEVSCLGFDVRQYNRYVYVECLPSRPQPNRNHLRYLSKHLPAMRQF